MVSQRKLGIYWGNSGISLVELNKDVLVTSAFVSFDELERDPVVGIRALNADVRLLELLQKTLRTASFSVSNAFLSFPSKEIIVRWFIIPWVKPEEIQNVVKFEAKKYIPFPLEELIFNYYPSTINKDGARQIGIALTAIRKIHYEQYANVLLQAGINVVYSEPSAMSQLRALAFRKLVSADKVTAILTVRDTSGEITIVSQGYVKFIRDFSFQTASSPSAEKDNELVRSKFFNEVRMSLDFFFHHNAGPEVDQIVVIASSMHRALLDMMGEDIGLPVQIVDPYQILEKFNSTPDISYVRAFGAALSGAVPSVIDFNLSEDLMRGKEKKKELAKKAPLISLRLLMVMGVIVLCSALAVLSWRWIDEQVQAKERAKKAIAAPLGAYVDIPRKDIDSQTSFLKNKIKAVRSVPLRSELTPLMLRFAQLMPKGVWLGTMEVSAKDDINWSSKPILDKRSGEAKNKRTGPEYYQVNQFTAMTISGFASLDDTNDEFALVNQFVEALGNDPQFKQAFGGIKLKSLQVKDYAKKKKVTAFTIEFK